MDVWGLVADEIASQIAKHGDGSVGFLSDFERLAVLVEEVGEVARALQEGRVGLADELVQVAAVAIVWVDACR